MDKMTQAAPQAFRGRMFQRDNSKPKEQRILILKTGVAALGINLKLLKKRGEADWCAPGLELQLVRSPKNPADAWAVEVHIPGGSRIGYITRFKNEPIARLMDAGKQLIAIIDDAEKELALLEGEDGERLQYNRADTENMELPFSIYLIEEL